MTTRSRVQICFWLASVRPRAAATCSVFPGAFQEIDGLTIPGVDQLLVRREPAGRLRRGGHRGHRGAERIVVPMALSPGDLARGWRGGDGHHREPLRDLGDLAGRAEGVEHVHGLEQDRDDAQPVMDSGFARPLAGIVSHLLVRGIGHVLDRDHQHLDVHEALQQDVRGPLVFARKDDVRHHGDRRQRRTQRVPDNDLALAVEPRPVFGHVALRRLQVRVRPDGGIHHRPEPPECPLRVATEGAGRALYQAQGVAAQRHPPGSAQIGIRGHDDLPRPPPGLVREPLQTPLEPGLDRQRLQLGTRQHRRQPMQPGLVQAGMADRLLGPLCRESLQRRDLVSPIQPIPVRLLLAITRGGAPGLDPAPVGGGEDVHAVAVREVGRLQQPAKLLLLAPQQRTKVLGRMRLHVGRSHGQDPQQVDGLDRRASEQRVQPDEHVRRDRCLGVCGPQGFELLGGGGHRGLNRVGKIALEELGQAWDRDPVVPAALVLWHGWLFGCENGKHSRDLLGDRHRQVARSDGSYLSLGRKTFLLPLRTFPLDATHACSHFAKASPTA